MGLILETTFLIDLEREVGRGGGGPAQALLKRRSDEKLYITFTVAGELAAGWRPSDRGSWERLIEPFHVLPGTPDVCWEYGMAFRYLKKNGLLIGGNDLWIGATGVAFEMPVVTRNAVHFRRIPGLEVFSYAER